MVDVVHEPFDDERAQMHTADQIHISFAGRLLITHKGDSQMINKIGTTAETWKFVVMIRCLSACCYYT